MSVKATLMPWCLVIVAAVTVSAQGTRSAAVRQIDKYVRSVERIVENKHRRKIVIADTAGDEDKRPKWKLFPSEKALDKYREDRETYTVVFNWKSNARTVASYFTLFSGSGDWAQYVYHYFRSDGSLAFVKSELRTFNGDYIVIRERYFDKHGNQLRKRSRYLDLTTKKPKEPTDELRDENSGYFRAAIYKKVAKLPFVRLLGGK